MSPIRKSYRIADRESRLALSCTVSGLSLAGAPLLRRTTMGLEPRPVEEIDTLIKSAYGDEDGANRLLGGLKVVAGALNEGDLSRAMMAALHLRLPDLDEEAAARVTDADNRLAKYDPDEPRDRGGRWTAGGSGADEPAALPATGSGPEGMEAPASANPAPSKATPGQPAEADGVFMEISDHVYPWVTDFRNKHLGEATKLATLIGRGATADEVLAVSGAEVKWALAPGTTEWGNYFGIHAKGDGSYFPGQVGVRITSGGVPVATFRPSDGFYQSGLIFASKIMRHSEGLDLSDPQVFARLAHQLGWGTKNPKYISLFLNSHHLLRNSARVSVTKS